MAVVGAFARVDPKDVPATRARLEQLDGVSIFDLDEPPKVGILIEADDIDTAHAILTRQVKVVDGVWGVWPIYVHAEPDEVDAEQVQQAVADDAC